MSQKTVNEPNQADCPPFSVLTQLLSPNTRLVYLPPHENKQASNRVRVSVFEAACNFIFIQTHLLGICCWNIGNFRNADDFCKAASLPALTQCLNTWRQLLSMWFTCATSTPSFIRCINALWNWNNSTFKISKVREDGVATVCPMLRLLLPHLFCNALPTTFVLYAALP